ncbi:hypothetical protein KUV50_09720 [Membranicola marinus]|uniref:Uncharacterized protein n=1 Tax=Membranihabitans marinus TaxID=1227546 RepID=A0A953LD27_9BACT|nr:hypothetical protein [Membranihabitans marinus]MBY5958409.1 hypothetical protein [Membranihabitans marinus]
MVKLTKNLIEDLSKFTGKHCISIYLPTHQYGEEVKSGKDIIVFKNSVAEVKDRLEESGMSPRKIESLLEPFYKLIEDPIFWNNQLDGLAVFAGEDFFKTVHLKTNVSKIQWVSDHFLLTPLIAHLEPKWEFYVLALDLKNITLYHGSNTDIEDITDTLPGLPRELTDVVSDEDRSAGLQFRSQQGGSGEAMYHGHGGGKEIRKKEILRFFREINESVISFLRSENKPLIIFSQEYLFPIYQEANEYGNLLNNLIAKHPAGVQLDEIHNKAWDLIKPLFFENRDGKIETFKQIHGVGKTTTDIEEIVLAGRQGRIDTLFIAKNKDILGYYDQSNNEVVVKEMPWTRKNSLVNDAAIHTFSTGGDVFPLEQDKMPDSQKPVNALLRQ